MAHAPENDSRDDTRTADRIFAANAAKGGQVGECAWCGKDVFADDDAGYMMWGRPEDEDDDVFCTLYHMLRAFDDETGTNLAHEV